MEHIGSLQVGYGSVESLTKAPSGPQVNTVETAVPEIAALPHEQLTIQDFPKIVFGQSLFAVEKGMSALRSHDAHLHE